MSVGRGSLDTVRAGKKLLVMDIRDRYTPNKRSEMRHLPTYAIGFILLTALPLFGQGINMMSSSFSGGPDGVMRGSATFGVSPFMPPPLKNAPYSGQEMSETKQTLIDGTNITRQTPRGAKTWRDSQGRVRTEGNRMGGGMVDANGNPAFVQIVDPVAGSMYVLDNVNRVAHRVQVSGKPQTPAAVARPAAPAALGVLGDSGVVGGMMGAVGGGGGFAGGGAGAVTRANRPRPEVTTEDLGTKTIDGVAVVGTRRTTIIPEGMQGNDRPMTTTSETWRSKELQLTLLTVDSSPMNGTTTTKIANFSTSEPDPGLFMVPTGYPIVDEKESFTIKWGEQ
jgi:hypothetical protein